VPRGPWWRKKRRAVSGLSLAVRESTDTPHHEMGLSGFDQHPAAADAVRNLCASILLSRADQPPRVLLITSTQAGEGKSTIARELAQTIGERGPKTLLVDCDLRRPTPYTRFGLRGPGGLSLWLAGVDNNLPAPQALGPSLSVVVAGPPSPNPVKLLDSDRMRAFVAHMRNNFEFIILDAPPVMGLADARVLAPVADGVVLVVRAGKAQKTAIGRACWHLESVGANVLGTVLNDAELDEASYDYYRVYSDAS
jgi:capsular exopolysaccharide synthesis family protein